MAFFWRCEAEVATTESTEPQNGRRHVPKCPPFHITYCRHLLLCVGRTIEVDSEDTSWPFSTTAGKFDLISSQQFSFIAPCLHVNNFIAMIASTFNEYLSTVSQDKINETTLEK
jgi:hypothetical protein